MSEPDQGCPVCGTADFTKHFPGCTYRMNDINKLCSKCGAPYRDHMIGGRSDYHPNPVKPTISNKYPVAWRVKDLRIGYVEFKDIGWVLFNVEDAAEEFAEQTGGEMQGLYVRDDT